ncbi:MAG: carboxypeptidase regulatory-like domain-containing protein [Lentisphaerae bacterium]|nr:carboxypeptidase regulatory-like domain-containing protein [Lentisphaerota bacterium]
MKKLMLPILGLMIASAVAALAAEQAPDLSVLPSTFRGVMLYPDGKTPADGIRVSVWNSDSEKVVFKTRTGKDGVFELPSLDEGSHYVTAGPVRIDMRLLRARSGVRPQAHGLVIVIPKRMPIGHILVPGAAAAGFIPRVMSP